MTPRDDLDRAYQQLTDMQKAVVDARVANPDVPKTHISRDHAPKIYNEEYADSEADHKDEFNNSHVTQMLNGNTNELIPEIIEYRQDIAHNQRSEGTMTTEGDPFTADPNMDDSEGWQTWDERPNKAAAQSDNPTDMTRPILCKVPSRPNHGFRLAILAMGLSSRLTTRICKSYWKRKRCPLS